MKKRTKWTVAGAITLAVVIIGVTSAMKGRNKATEVRVEKVERRDLVASVTASGQVQPHTKVDISADISGRIVRLAVKEGQMVTAGQFLLEIDPSQYRASVERATAAVASARSQAAQSKPALLQARRNYDRTIALKKANPTVVYEQQIEQLRESCQHRWNGRVDRSGDRLRGDDSAAQCAARDSPGFLGDGQDHHVDSQQRVVDSDHRAHRPRGQREA